MLRLQKILIFGLFLNTMASHGQVNIIKYPVRFSQYYISYTTVNPAAAGCYGNYEFAAGSKKLLGNLSKISTYYAVGNMRIGRTVRYDESFSSIGFMFYNDREGKYLQRNRGYLIYAWNGQLTPKIRFSGGLQIGAMNYSVKGTELSGDGSDIAADGSAGIRFYNSNFHIGISYNQVFNSKIQPLEETAYLSSYFNLTGSYLFNLSNDVKFSPACNIRILTGHFDSQTDFNLQFYVIEKIFVSSGIHNSDMLEHTLGLTNLLETIGGFDIYFTYSYFYRKTGLNINFAELGIKYLLKK